MADAANLFDLAARISVDASQSDKALTATQKQVLKLADDFKKAEQSSQASFSKVAQSAKAVEQKLAGTSHATSDLHREFVRASLSGQGFHAQLVELASGSSLLANPMLVAGGAIAAIGASAYEASKFIFELSEKAAKFGDDVFKAHEKTALSVATLSALKIAGAEVGVELSTMTTGLIRFTNNLELAAAGNKKMANELKQLGVTAFQDNDKALQQFITRFAQLRTDQERTVAAGQAFGVRFGANLVEVFNQVGGNIDQFKEKLRSMGLLMTEEEAEAAHKFEVELGQLELRLSGLGRTIGQETIPAFEAGFAAIDAALDADKTKWKEWGDDLAKIILSVETLLGGLANVAAKADWTNFIPIYGPGKAGKDFLDGVSKTADEVTKAYNTILNPPVGGNASIGTGARFHLAPEGAGGRGGGSKRDAGLELLKQLQREYDNLSAKTEIDKINLRLLEAQYASINPKVSAHIRLIANMIDVKKEQEKVDADNKKQADANSEAMDRFVAQQSEQMRQLKYGSKSFLDTANDFIVAFNKMGGAFEHNEPFWFRFNAMELQVIKDTDRLTQSLLDAADALPEFKVPDFDPSKIGVDIEAQIGAPPKNIYAEMERARQRAQELASDLTNMIDNALHDGFEKGIKAGLISFAQGILQMIESAALKALEKRLTDIFANILGGTGNGGGFSWSKLLINLAGAAAGGAGGGKGGAIAGTGGKFAAGGFMQPDSWNLVGERGPEFIRAGGRGATVVPNSGLGGNQFHVHINVPNVQAAGSPATQHQVAKQMHALMAKAVLTG